MTALLCGLIVLAALGVVGMRNPVYSLLLLILGFGLVSVVMILHGLSYIGFMLLIVYVGAIAILFLFVVMMLNVSTETTRVILRQKRLLFPMGAGILLTGILVFDCLKNPTVAKASAALGFKDMGELLYTKYGVGVLIMGLLLLIGMVAAIAIVGTQKMNKEHLTNYGAIQDRTPQNSLEFKQMPLRKGVE